MTELDLKQAILSESAVAYLKQVIPASTAPTQHLDYETWLDRVFSEPMQSVR